MVTEDRRTIDKSPPRADLLLVIRENGVTARVDIRAAIEDAAKGGPTIEEFALKLEKVYGVRFVPYLHEGEWRAKYQTRSGEHYGSRIGWKKADTRFTVNGLSEILKIDYDPERDADFMEAASGSSSDQGRKLARADGELSPLLSDLPLHERQVVASEGVGPEPSDPDLPTEAQILLAMQFHDETGVPLPRGFELSRKKTDRFIAMIRRQKEQNEKLADDEDLSPSALFTRPDMDGAPKQPHVPVAVKVKLRGGDVAGDSDRFLLEISLPRQVCQFVNTSDGSVVLRKINSRTEASVKDNVRKVERGVLVRVKRWWEKGLFNAAVPAGQLEDALEAMTDKNGFYPLEWVFTVIDGAEITLPSILTEVGRAENGAEVSIISILDEMGCDIRSGRQKAPRRSSAVSVPDAEEPYSVKERLKMLAKEFFSDDMSDECITLRKEADGSVTFEYRG